jgi:tRNA1(Val) A37 N6-methylase TrmN6
MAQTAQAQSSMNKRTEKKRLGAFYTPPMITQLLAGWAIRDSKENILEPGFGGCGFLEAAITRLDQLGSDHSQQNVFGCDIDPEAFHHLAEKLGHSANLDRYLLRDFLKVRSKEMMWPEFDVVLGNPPYVPYQSIPETERSFYQATLKDAGFRIHANASLWAYFIIHAFSFLREGGRVAWVLPGSFLQADYARAVKQYFCKHFASVYVISLKERAFLDMGTDESTVILLAEGWCRKSREGDGCRLAFAETIESLPEVITRMGHGEGIHLADGGSLGLSHISDIARDEVSGLIVNPECVLAGTMLSARIGLVTGANNYFVVDKGTAVSEDLFPRYVSPVLAKFRHVPGLCMQARDVTSVIAAGARCLLISSASRTIPSNSLGRYLQKLPQQDVQTNSTFKKRALWYCPDDGNIPDAFFPVMHDSGPRIALNLARINCTNSVHRIYFKKNLTLIQKKLISISILTSFSQVHAEIVGRTYGSGVLKHEPRDVERIALLMPSRLPPAEITLAYGKIDRLLRNGDPGQAQAVADELIYPAIFGDIKSAREKSAMLSTALNTLRTARRPDRRVSSIKRH